MLPNMGTRKRHTVKGFHSYAKLPWKNSETTFTVLDSETLVTLKKGKYTGSSKLSCQTEMEAFQTRRVQICLASACLINIRHVRNKNNFSTTA